MVAWNLPKFVYLSAGKISANFGFLAPFLLKMQYYFELYEVILKILPFMPQDIIAFLRNVSWKATYIEA